MKENSLKLKLTLVDEYTGNVVSIDGDTADSGSGWGKRSYEVISGDITVKEFYDISTQPYNAKVAILGDSFVEGNSLLNARNYRYAYLMKQELDGNMFINGQGGASSSSGLEWMKNYILDVVHPQYMILAFGMNESDYDLWLTNMQEMCKLLESNGIIPVLVTITPTENDQYANDVHMKMNEYIRSSEYRYIDAAVACSKDNDGVTFKEDMFMGDQVHPSIESHKLIFERAKADVPELFK